ncbi:uncharacterized protein C8Q71DRAFT_738749 [Rhodofomes roseus]|uniref:Uncharacterized protein n=1 Tax=Rhodofomes roseus TaxID=34475 RepID=A0ABQ8KSH9_9APHY|nr:uncharacterized protein C8Q71DRAFT_738749 [Rhodofomes roseus]KAH9841778.1 hypothetical protein C8Q71DRAFT_738749 [Rhodofomes roseus]
MASSSRQRAVQANLDDARSEKLDTVFRAIQAGGMTFGGFLREAFTVPPPQVSKGNTARHSQLVSAFLGGRSSESAHEIVELMYSSRYSAPIPVRDSPRRPGHEAPRPDAKKMARWGLREWAVEKVEDIVDEEAEDVTSKAGGFHLRDKDATWDFMFSFTMENILSVINARVPTTLCVITAAAIPRRVRKPPGAPQDASATFCGTYYSKEPDSNGDRGKRRDPMLITLIACLLLFGARNLQFTAFQKFIGIWLFAHTASSDIYAVFSRFGVSVSYSSVLRLLRSLSQSAQMVIQRVATARAFLLIYDNINRMASPIIFVHSCRRSRRPELPLTLQAKVQNMHAKTSMLHSTSFRGIWTNKVCISSERDVPWDM